MIYVIQIIATLISPPDDIIGILPLLPVLAGVIPPNPFSTGTIPQGVPQPGTRKSMPII